MGRSNRKSRREQSRRIRDTVQIDGKRLKDLRIELGWSQNELMLQVDLGSDKILGNGYIGSIEQGRKTEGERKYIEAIEAALMKRCAERGVTYRSFRNGPHCPKQEAGQVSQPLITPRSPAPHDPIAAETHGALDQSLLTGSPDKSDQQRDREYVALARDGLFEAALQCAREGVRRALPYRPSRTLVHWATRLAAAYRAMGQLVEATQWYSRASGYCADALANADDASLQCQAIRIQFGQIMVDVFHSRGRTADAYSAYSTMIDDIDRLAELPLSAHLHRTVSNGRLHVQRQQAEMLRMMGAYGQALRLIRTVRDQYQPSDVEPRRYATLGEADTLRLLGRLDKALALYDGVIDEATHRGLDGLRSAALWRRASAHQARGAPKDAWRDIGEMRRHDMQYLRFAELYRLLSVASGVVEDHDTALRALEQAVSYSQMSRTFLTLEYAHMCLCKGELLRTVGNIEQSRHWFGLAHDTYLSTQCTWGIVRSWLGMKLTGHEIEFPTLDHQVEGCDAAIIGRRRTVPCGQLSAGLP